MLTSYKRLFVFSLIVSLMYAFLVIVVSMALAFPGFGVIILPQPFLAIHGGRWTMAYNPFTLMTIPWFLYILVFHCLAYSFLENTHPQNTRPYLYTGLLLLILNLGLVIIGLADLLLRLFVLIYMRNALYWMSSIPLNIGIEYIGYKIGKQVVLYDSVNKEYS